MIWQSAVSFQLSAEVEGSSLEVPGFPDVITVIKTAIKLGF